MTTSVDPGRSILTRCPIVPVVVLDDPDQALPLGEALLAGGIDVVEITLRTSAGIEAIRRLADLPGLHVGAGSVLVPAQVDAVVDAGARFVVSPGLSRDVVARSRARGVPALPGVATASELMAAVDLGLTEVKFFPAACSAARPGSGRWRRRSPGCRSCRRAASAQPPWPTTWPCPPYPPSAAAGWSTPRSCAMGAGTRWPNARPRPSAGLSR